MKIHPAPAGVEHKCLTHTDDFTALRAYLNGLSPDLNKGEKRERHQTDKNIAAVLFFRYRSALMIHHNYIGCFFLFSRGHQQQRKRCKKYNAYQ